MLEKIFELVEWCILIPYLIISITTNVLKEYFSDKKDLKKSPLL